MLFFPALFFYRGDMTKEAWQDSFPHSAEIFPFMLDAPSQQMILLRLAEANFAKASFLDQRLLAGNFEKYVTSWPELAALIPSAFQAPDYIFHIGHVGSTLISRLLGEVDGVFALREPMLLRSLAEMKDTDNFAQYVALSVSWLSRSFCSSDRSMIKATSFVNEIATDLLMPESKALFLFVPLQKYIETILAGGASRQEILQMSEARQLRLNSVLDEPLDAGPELTLCQHIAISWLCEMASLRGSERDRPDTKIMWTNFDHFLENTEMKFLEILTHFDLDMPAGGRKELLAGPIMNSYSKAPEHGYSADTRHQLLKDARSQHAAEIDDCQAWVTGLSKRHPMIEELLNFSQR